MTTTAEVLLKIAQNLGAVRFSTADATGSTTALIDSTLNEPPGYYTGGTIWFITGNLAGKTARVTNWATHTFTFATQSAATASGDRYAVATKEYRREELVNALDLAMDELGPFDAYNETLVTVLDQEKYTLPAGVYNVKRVEIASSATSPYEWEQPHRYWREDAGYLYFDDDHLPLTASLPIRLVYAVPHTAVNADADTINNAVNPELLAALAALHAARVRAIQVGLSDKQAQLMMQTLAPRVAALRAQFPVRKQQHTPRWPSVPNSSRSW